MKVKQVIVIRTDLNMRKGKMIAQGAHASMKVILNMAMWNMPQVSLKWCIDHPGETPPPTRMSIVDLKPEVSRWLTGKFTKICVKATSEEELLSLYQQALDADLPCALIQDAGDTEFHGVPTYTALAIGPAQAEELDPITGNQALL